MSEEIETKEIGQVAVEIPITAEPTELSAAEKSRALLLAVQKSTKEKVESRITELKTYVGKYFKRKDGNGHLVKITGYAGAMTRPTILNGQPSSETLHAFNAETKDARWTPPATQFLEEHEVVPYEETESKKEII